MTGPHPVSHIVCAAADVRYLTLGSNPFLRWQAVAALSRLGYHTNDLNGAAPESPVTRFKAPLGGQLAVNWAITRPLTLRYRLWQRGERLLVKAQ